jgi:hypothetical protein
MVRRHIANFEHCFCHASFDFHLPSFVPRCLPFLETAAMSAAFHADKMTDILVLGSTHSPSESLTESFNDL